MSSEKHISQRQRERGIKLRMEKTLRMNARLASLANCVLSKREKQKKAMLDIQQCRLSEKERDSKRQEHTM